MSAMTAEQRKALEDKLAAYRRRRDDLRLAHARLEEKARASRQLEAAETDKLLSMVQATSLEDAEAKIAEVYAAVDSAVADLDAKVAAVAR